MAEDNSLKKKVQDDIYRKLINLTTPHMKVAHFITDHLVEGVKLPNVTKREVFVQSSYGAISAMALLEKNLPESASSILRAAADAAHRIGADQTDTMTWAMEGIAKITPAIKPSDVGAMSAAIDADYHGAGQIFNDICSRTRGT